MARLDAHHGRSRSAASTIGNAAAAQHRKLLTGRKKPSYKVVIEQVQKKKELITAVGGRTRPLTQIISLGRLSDCNVSLLRVPSMQIRQRAIHSFQLVTLKLRIGARSWH